MGIFCLKLLAVCCRWSRCPREGRAANTSWPVPVVWQPQSSWAVAGALEFAPGRASVRVDGGMSPAHLGSLGWDLLCKQRCISLCKTLNFKVALYSIFCFIDTVLSTDCSPWWSNRANGVWMGVPVPHKTRHQLQDSPSPTRTDRLHCDSSQEQQHTVSNHADLIRLQVQSVSTIDQITRYHGSTVTSVVNFYFNKLIFANNMLVSFISICRQTLLKKIKNFCNIIKMLFAAFCDKM